MTSAITIEEIAIPGSLDDPGALNFVRLVDVRNAIEAHPIGKPVMNLSVGEMLPSLLDQTYDRKRLFAARLDGEIVGQVILAWATDAASVSWIRGGVLPECRNRGIGTALFDHLEAIARESGRPLIQTGATHLNIAGEDRLAPPTGFGTVPAHDPGVRFLRGRGYSLEQIYRISFLHLPVEPARLTAQREQAEAAAGPDYRVTAWNGPVPDRWLDDIARLQARMSTDAPSAGLEIDEEAWDAARVRAQEARAARAGRVHFVAAVEHVPSGHLVAFTGVSVPDDRGRSIRQGPTLVLTEHRGHRLGMLVKVVNIQELARHSPESSLIMTDNAEENRPMLNVNEAVGFEAVAYEGGWKKTT